MKLIPDWRRAWRMTSVQLAAMAVLFGTLPADTQAAVLDMVGVPATRVPAILGLLFILGRIVGQPRLAATPAKEDEAS
jgi:hypothetical protein